MMDTQDYVNGLSIRIKDAIDSDVPIISWPTWPKSGKSYEVVFEVEHIGRSYDDLPSYTMVSAPPEVEAVLFECTFEEVVGSQQLPIASGLFKCTLEFFSESWADWESGIEDPNFGFILHNLEKLQ